MCIGRAAEGAEIRVFLGQLHAGPRVLLIEGETGMGKSTLLREGRNKAAELGFTVLSACPVESEAPLDFAGLADLLDTVPDAVIDALPGPQRRAIRQAVLRTEYQGRTADPRTMATAVLTLLRHLARRHPVVVAIDDLPWLDVSSARLLSFALRRLRFEPVGLLAAVQKDSTAIPPPLVTNSVPAERVESLRLGPLGLEAIRELLATRTTLCFRRSLLIRLYETSGGNPLFALELAARAAAGAGPGPGDGLDVPDSLQRLVKGKVIGLPPGVRDVLLISSLAAEPVLAVISAAARVPTTAHADLQAGIQAGLLVHDGGHVAFVQPLMRSVVIDQASAADRRAAHHRLAAVSRSPEARARHLAMGVEGPDETVAEKLEDSARGAARRGACDTAGDLAELAVMLTPLDLPGRQRRRTVLAAGARFEASDPARACSLLEGVIDAEPPSPARAELQRRLARYRVFCGEPLASWTASLARALDEAGGNTDVRAVIMLDQAVAASHAGNFPEAIRSAKLTLVLAERTGNKSLEAQCCAELAFTTFLHGGGLRQDLIGRALAGPEQAARLSIDLRPGVAVGHILHWTDDLDGARVLYQQEYVMARENGIQTGLPLLLWAQAENEGWAGNWPRAEYLAAEGYRLAEDSGSLWAIALMAAARGLLHAYRGRLDAARSDAALAVGFARYLGMPLLATMAAQVLGIAALSAGDARQAHMQLGPIAASASAAGVTEPGLCRYLPDEVEALIRLGDLDAAEAVLDPFEVRSAWLGRTWGIAAASRCRGLLLAARGDLADAGKAIDTAVAMHQYLPMPFEEARTLLAAGEVHRRARHKRRAVELLRSALAIFEQLGAPLWRQRVLDELARGGSSVTAPGSGQVLTAAEQRVADLVAAGRTNPEIAGELFMGQRTVEAHLSRVFRKLGVRSRTELCRMLILPRPDRTR